MNKTWNGIKELVNTKNNLSTNNRTESQQLNQ